MERKKIETFDDWKELFHAWQKDIGYDTKLFSSILQGYEFGEKFGEFNHNRIGFGEFAGASKWESPGEIPRPEIQDLLLRLVMVQGDTEFASVEQQRKLIDSAPSEKDLRSIIRINAEEMRHGWQMSYLLVNYFGDTGKSEARQLLERRADKRGRLLGAFNEPMEDWVDFFTYTGFVDRDGMYQLKMLSFSSFGPLSRSMGPMLNEESYHLLTGLTGLQRILKARRVPVEIVQKVLNRWLPACFDLFGHERSWGVAKAYRWGLKGRFNEPEAGLMDDAERLNDAARELYRKEIQGIVEFLNKEIAEDQPKLYVPDIKFHRAIGDYKGQRFSVRGEPLSEDAYARHQREVLPTAPDRKKLRELTKEPDWIAPAL